MSRNSRSLNKISGKPGRIDCMWFGGIHRDRIAGLLDRVLNAFVDIDIKNTTSITLRIGK